MNISDANYQVEERQIPFGEYSTWSRITRPNAPVNRAPLVVLHGGPGIPHNYCRNMIGFCDDGREVIHYDQIGCGLSTHLPNVPANFWDVQLFVDELRNLVNHYNLHDGFHLLGQSWGGMLAPEYVLAHPTGVLSMTLADSPASMKLWTEGTNELLTQLPEAVQRVIQEHEAAGTTDSAAYQDAVGVFYRKHMCRIDPFPQDLEDSFAGLAADPTVYQTMIGPSEFSANGTLKNWSVIDRLHRIQVPSLVVAGEFDEARPVAWQPFVDKIPVVRAHVFSGASHTPHLECPDDYFAVVGAFLRKHDQN